MHSRRDFVESALALAASARASVAVGLSQQSDSASAGNPNPAGVLQKRDYRDQPFRVAVAFGASITAGGAATSPELDWVSLLEDLINSAQLEPVRMHNNGIGANAISPRSFHYQETSKPSAVERYQDHIIAYRPDLPVMDYGTNDARGGTPLAQFLEDERKIILDVKKQTGALVVIMNLCFMTAFERYAPFDQANVATLEG